MNEPQQRLATQCLDHRRTLLASKCLRPLDNHTRWLSAADLSPSALNDLLLQSRSLWEFPEDVRESLSQHLKDRGGSGRSARPTITQVSARAVPTEQLNWKSLIDRAAGFTTRRAATYGPPPRRVPHLVGIVAADRIRGHRQSIMAVIDTSRSMTFVHWDHVLGELNRLNALGEVTVVECDNEIRDCYPLRDAIKRVTGRGSTDLRPVFEPEFLAKVRPDVVVYFTDGEGPAPDRAPRVPVVWCLTPDGRRPAPWGVIARLPV